MTDGGAPRPAPQYGEYATPEQQQEIMRRTAPPASPAAQSAPADVRPSTAGPSVGAPAAGQVVPATGPRRRADRWITIALLAYGLVTVVTSLPQLAQYTTFVEVWADMAGIDAELAVSSTGRGWGVAAAVVFFVGWALTALLCIHAMRRGRLSWWIALVGAAVTFIITSVLLSVPLFSDPAVVEQLLSVR